MGGNIFYNPFFSLNLYFKIFTIQNKMNKSLQQLLSGKYFDRLNCFGGTHVYINLASTCVIQTQTLSLLLSSLLLTLFIITRIFSSILTKINHNMHFKHRKQKRY